MKMKHCSWALRMILTIGIVVGSGALSSGQDLPVLKGKKVVAMVNGEPITLDEFNRELTGLHKRQDGEKKAGKEDQSELLKRLINIRLIVQEGMRIGLMELPETKKRVDGFSRATLREELMEKHAREVKADEKEVERLYRASIKEYKVESVFLEKEENAKEMESELKEGKNYEGVSRKFIAGGKAKEEQHKNYLKAKDLVSQVAETLSKMEVGSVSPIVRVESGFIIIRLDDIRFPENPEARESVRLEVLRREQIKAIENYNNALIKKYVKIHKEVLDRVDYESKEPGFDALLKDQRVVAEIKGEAPITVGELTGFLKQQFYHGVERAIESKKLNQRKTLGLEEMLHKRVFRKEALRLGLDKTESYKTKVKEFENSIIFDMFVQKAILPDTKIKEEEIKSYYNVHLKEYSYPEMVRIKSLVFKKREVAEGTIEKLRKGTEFQWISENAEGQVDKDTKGVLVFDGKLLTVDDLPPEVEKAVSGTSAGNFRLYASPEGFFYVLAIQEVIPSKPKSYEEARQDAAKKVFNEELKKALEEYVDKLKAVSEVKVYLKN